MIIFNPTRLRQDNIGPALLEMIMNSRFPDDWLFSSVDWLGLEKSYSDRLVEEVSALDGDHLLNAEATAMEHFFIEHFSFDLPVLRTNEISIDHREVDIDISHRFDRIPSRFGPNTTRGVEYEAHIPFTGDPGLFKIQPSYYNINRVKGHIDDKAKILIHRLSDVQLSSAQIEASVDTFVAEVHKYLEFLSVGISVWNSNLAGTARSLLEKRRAKLIQERTAASNSKFKLRSRSGTDNRTYIAPEIRRKLLPTMPSSGSSSWVPEPVLDHAQYEHILRVITDSALSWERSPAAFSGMGEEDLRTQFLFQLNGHFEGQATGETFNKEGKTDILIRCRGKNIFIGECKFWAGAKVITETIDQLLSYTSWRDTKVAVILFNRNKSFTSVLAQIRPTVESHTSFVQFVSQVTDSQFCFIFKQPSDPNRHLTLTILAFDVPKCE